LQAISYVQQAVPTAALASLNDADWAAYWWLDRTEKPVQAERKTWSDLTSGLDIIEYQLRQQMKAHPEARRMLIVEGVALPSMMGTVVYQQSKGSKRDVFYASREQQTRFSMIMAWLYQVEKFIEVYFTADLRATCQALVAFYQADQKENHQTFERYLRVADWHANPQVEAMMAIGRGVGIGPAKAEALIKRFGTIWAVLSARPDQLQQVAGLGRTNSLRLLRKVGRLDL